MALGFTYRLELEDGTPADPPTFRSAPSVTWRAGDTIPLGGRTLRVVAVRDDDGDQSPVLVVDEWGQEPLASDRPGEIVREGRWRYKRRSVRLAAGR